MSLSTWLSGTFSHSQAPRAKRRNPASRPKKARFSLEPLEPRALLTSYTAASVSALIADITAANTAGGANTITLTAPTTSRYALTARNNSSFITGANGLPVIAANDNLTIVGNDDAIEGRLTKNPSATFRLFDVAPEASLTLQNLTLEFGQAGAGAEAAADSGRGIYNMGALTLSGVTMTGNYAGFFGEGPAFGGGIWSNGSLILEDGTLLQNNFAWGSGTAPTLGGAVYIAGGTASITSTTFARNEVEEGQGDVGPSAFGGALYVAAGQVNVTNSTVNENQAAAGKGGGFYVAGGTVTLTGDTVESNVGEYGGGLYVAAGTVTLTSDTVESNYAPFDGGGIYIAGGTVTLTGDTVESNFTYVDGGGIYIAGGTVTLTGDTVESNSTRGDGGGIFIASGATVYLDAFTVANTINNTDESGLNGPTANIDGTYTLS